MHSRVITAYWTKKMIQRYTRPEKMGISAIAWATPMVKALVVAEAKPVATPTKHMHRPTMAS